MGKIVMSEIYDEFQAIPTYIATINMKYNKRTRNVRLLYQSSIKNLKVQLHALFVFQYGSVYIKFCIYDINKYYME